MSEPNVNQTPPQGRTARQHGTRSLPPGRNDNIDLLKALFLGIAATAVFYEVFPLPLIERGRILTLFEPWVSQVITAMTFGSFFLLLLKYLQFRRQLKAQRAFNDPRLMAFATTLARARFLVLVPDLPNLRALKVRAEDVQGLVDAFVHLLSRPELPSRSPAGIGAFSYAVGLAVLAALEPSIRERVDFVLGVGGYYDLHRVVTFFTTGYFQKEGQWHYLEPNRNGKWVFVLSNVDRFRDARDRLALRTMAERKLNDPQARVDDLKGQLTPEGLSVLDLLENRDPARTPALFAKLPVGFRAELDTLNLARRDLSQLRARLILLHGTDDAIIPYTESMALATAAPSGQSELFLIDGLAHVNVRPLKLDRHTSWRAIGVLLAQRKDPGEGRQ